MVRSTRFLAMAVGVIALIATGLLSISSAEARPGGRHGWHGHGWHGHGGHGHWRHGGHWGHGWRHAHWHRGWRGGGVWGAGFYPAVYARPVFAPPPVYPAAYMPPPPPPMAYGYGAGYGYQSGYRYRKSSSRRYVRKASQPACVCKCCPETPAAASPPAPLPGPVDK